MLYDTKFWAVTWTDDSTDWMTSAKCLKSDTMSFDDTKPSLVLPAKEFCSDCPVKLSCRKWAVKTRQEWGVWGGLTTQERRRNDKGAPVRTCRFCDMEYVGRMDRCGFCPRSVSAGERILFYSEDIISMALDGKSDTEIAIKLTAKAQTEITKSQIRAARRQLHMPSGPFIKQGPSGRVGDSYDETMVQHVEKTHKDFSVLTIWERIELFQRWTIGGNDAASFSQAYGCSQGVVYALGLIRDRFEEAFCQNNSTSHSMS